MVLILMLRLDYVQHDIADGLAPSVSMLKVSMILSISDGNIFAFCEQINYDINYVNMNIDPRLWND